MNDVNMAAFTAPKTDQLNADSLLSGPITVTITGVRANEGSAEQPVSISYTGDDNKPYKPCKSMRRVMVHVWGPDAKQYIGRSMTLYCDPNVQFGGMKVGGIRISHMSHIDKPQTMALTATKARRAPFTVQPLQAATPPAAQPAAKALTADEIDSHKSAMHKAGTMEELATAFAAAQKYASTMRDGKAQSLFVQVKDACKAALLAPTDNIEQVF